jgi:hypothetical protein
MARPSQQRREVERNYERDEIRRRLDLGDDYFSLRTLRALNSLLERIEKLEKLQDD